MNFSWEQTDGDTIRGDGKTRDISASGVFVVASDPVPSGTVLTLQIVLPSLRSRRSSGASLRTLGHVVRSEARGFAVAADTGFRMQFPETQAGRNDRESVVNANDAQETSTRQEARKKLEPVSRFSM